MTPTTDTNVETKSRRRTNHTQTPQEILAGFRQQHPKATAPELREIARQYILENTEFESAAPRNFTMWLVDRSLAREIKEAPLSDPAASEQARQERASARQRLMETLASNDEKRIENEVQIRMLEYQTTYGKALGDCTGAECDRLSRRYGDFFFELAKRITRSETVRAHLTEVELQAIARTHRLIGEKATR